MAGGSEERKGADGGIGGFLRNFADLMNKLEEVAETGEPITKTGNVEFGPRGPEGRKPAKGVFGFSVNVGLPGQQPRIEPFGNIRRDADSGESLVEEAREPLVDVFDEDERLLVIAELPGIDAEDIHVELAGPTLTLSAEHGDRKYEKRIEVPEGLCREGLKVSCRNGIAEISCPKG
jgi:HSP20 family protein